MYFYSLYNPNHWLFFGSPIPEIVGVFEQRVITDSGVFEAKQCLENQLESFRSADLLDTASLIVTPNAYKEGKLYSVIPSDGSGDLSVTRATTATRVNSQGLVELVPYNLLTYSEDFSNAAWTKIRTTISANAITAPNGTLTADKLVEDSSAASTHLATADGVVINNATKYTFSVYLKAAERKYAVLYLTGTGKGKYFDLENGIVGGDFVSAPISAAIESVGNGWYRCSIVSDSTSTSTSARIYLADTISNTSYTGNGTSGLYIWGAQLNEGTLKDYFPTQTRLNIPRLDYSLGSCPSILVEPQRTNLALWSEQFDNAAWSKNAVSVTANATTSPSGVLTADRMTANGTSNIHQINLNGFATLTAGVTYTTSIYAKADTNNFIQITGTGLVYSSTTFANFDLANGVVGAVGAGVTSSITNLGNGWYRCSMTATAILTSIGNSFLVTIISNANSVRGEVNTLSTSVFLWGAQLEAGAYATSYIPTTSASVTRNQDYIVKSGISSLIGSTQGTLFAEISSLSNTVTSNSITISDGTYDNRASIIYSTGTNIIRVFVRVGGVLQFDANSTAFNITNFNKIAFAYKNNDFVFYINGQLIASSASALAFSANALNTFGFNEIGTTGVLNGRVKAAALWKTRLSNAELATLTTL